MNDVQRVTQADVEKAIVAEYFFTAAHGADGAARAGELWAHLKADGLDSEASLQLLTFCVLVLRNGFTVVGQAACADPAAFDVEIGRRVAREDATNKVWPLLGYALKSRMAEG